MKRIISVLLAMVITVAALCGCSSAPEQDGLKIVCSVFPLYDWMRQLTAGSDDIELILIADNGVDMHSYQPTTGDIVDISTCDMLVYVGGDSEEWVEETADRSGNERMHRTAMLDILGEDALCAVPHEHDEEQVEHGHIHHHHHDEDAKDEHVWLSPLTAMRLCEELTEVLCVTDPEGAEIYRNNCERYTAALSALDESYRQAVEEATDHILLFADRFPFRYLAADYGIEYHAAFDGCEAETEASFETIARLAAEVDAHELDCVLIIDGSEDALARTIINSSEHRDAQILALDSLQSVSEEDISKGVTYLSVMEDNLEILRQALGFE